MTEEMQRKEAISRIKKLTKKFNLNSDLLEYFEDERIYGIDFVEDSKIPYKEELISDIITNFQKKFNAVVYYFNVKKINIGNYDLEILSIFYVGQNKESWEIERLSKDNEMYIETYILNDNPPTPEFGFVKVGSFEGNLVRES